MNALLTILPLLLFAQAESSLWLLVGIILFSGLVMSLQLYHVNRKKPDDPAGKDGMREEQPEGFLSGYPVVYLIYSRIKDKSCLEIISMSHI